MPKATLDKQWRYKGIVYGPGQGDYPQEVIDGIKAAGGNVEKTSSSQSKSDD